jgi:hypothetical protein
VDGVAAGYLVGPMREPGETRPIRLAVLEAMYVHPGHCRRGIGAAPIDAFRSWAGRQPAGHLSVTAHVTNTDASALASKCRTIYSLIPIGGQIMV